MLKKIEINNVGRFKTTKTEGDDQFFKKNTFIYGKNTFGKSTLTSIFRSLKDNNPDYIVGRKTVGSQKQLVRIIPEVTTPTGEYRYMTDEAKWSSVYQDIIVFDNHFVRESIYTQNQQIGQEQQKNIESFMLGARGVTYNEQIEDLAKQIADNAKVQTSISSEYNRNKHLLGGLILEAFLKIAQTPDIDRKIEQDKKDLDKVKNSELISNKLNGIKELLERYTQFDSREVSENFSVNSELVAMHFKERINQDETKQAYGDFLQAGSKLRTRTKDERCPFCTQEMDDSAVKEFLGTIDQIYNEKYRNLQRALKNAEGLFPQDSFTVEIDRLKTDLKQAGYTVEIDFSDIDNLITSCKKVIDGKKEDLSIDFDSAPFSNLSSKSTVHINTIDAELTNFKNPTEKKAQLESSLKMLEANKERFGSWNERCDHYLKAQKESKLLSAKKTKLWEEYLVYASGLSANMLRDINEILTACNCDFEVQKFNFKGNQRQDLLVLSMAGSKILNDGHESEMTVKNCLSDSDKWILALAFFLATVKNDITIKVVIMDDPVSSFDSDRKRIILTEIKRILSGTDKQLILLTHEKGFYQLLHAESICDPTSVFLKISLDSVKGSKIFACDPYEDIEFMSDYNCWISDMKNALQSQDLYVIKNAHGCIRKVIEHVLRVKYPLELTKDIQTIGGMLTKLEEPSGHYATESKRSSIDSVLINLDHHDYSAVGQYPSGQLGPDDYKKNIRDTFKLIKNL